jgi:ABC-type multidrug transport system ATPase subunit
MLLPLEYRRKSGFVPRDHSITREEFIKHYPTFLLQVHSEESDNSSNLLEGIDICFQNLSLQVTVAKKEINVVNEVTGRICAKTMTALMGGSGAGKTSLLNALCGRAHYGTILGDIHINGKKMAIDEIKSLTGFVPQDDVVYAELTVRENLMYAGKLTLPRNTSLEEIEDLADTTLANLGLVRVADSLVGDVKRRGVSGGEKKRVNIGLELMARPGCLFLDEPTSGLVSDTYQRRCLL